MLPHNDLQSRSRGCYNRLHSPDQAAKTKGQLDRPRSALGVRGALPASSPSLAASAGSSLSRSFLRSGAARLQLLLRGGCEAAFPKPFGLRVGRPRGGCCAQGVWGLEGPPYLPLKRKEASGAGRSSPGTPVGAHPAAGPGGRDTPPGSRTLPGPCPYPQPTHTPFLRSAGRGVCGGEILKEGGCRWMHAEDTERGYLFQAQSPKASKNIEPRYFIVRPVCSL